MKLGVFTVVLGEMPLDAALDWLAERGVEAVELGCGGYPGDAHCPPGSDPEALRRAVESRGLALSALSAHANPLHPDAELAASGDRALRAALRLAERLEVGVVNAFSGCPGDSPDASAPNWVTCAWPPEFADVLRWQWEERALPYWSSIAELARGHGVQVAIEPHPGFLVYNVRTLLRLRSAVGDAIGVNFDPSHLWWQGADPVAAIEALGAAGALLHVHAKDTELIEERVRVDGVLETAPADRPDERAWRFRTVGRGHGDDVWRGILGALRGSGYDGAISIEHEDRLIPPREGLQEAIAMLRPLTRDQ